MFHALSIPAGVEHRSVRTEEFLISFAEPFRVVFLGTLLTLEVLCINAGAWGEWWLLAGLLPALTCLLSAVSVGIIVWRYRFTVGPEGIGCYDFWCRPLTTRWEEMESFVRVGVPGLAYVRIGIGNRFRALWLPLFVADLDGLRRLVALHAGARHPLSQLLAREVG